MNYEITIPDSVVSRTVQNEEVILDLKSSRYYGLNELGSRVWLALKNKEKMEAVVESISEEYEASPDLIKKDIEALLKKMKKSGLVQF
jgi:hypothetical protein